MAATEPDPEISNKIEANPAGGGVNTGRILPGETMPAADEVRQRVARLQEKMAAAGLDSVFIMQPAQLYYFVRTAQQGLAVVPAAGDPVVFIRRSCSRAAGESCFTVEPLPAYRLWPETLARYGINPGKTGIEMDVLPVAEYFKLAAAFRGTEFKDVAPLTREIRMIKSPYEIDCHREAGRRLVSALGCLAGMIKPGQDERALTAVLESAQRREGDPGLVRVRNWRAEITTGIVAIGPSAAFPAAFDGPVGNPGGHPGHPAGPGYRILERNQPVMVDTVASAGGYIADVTRVFSCGPLPQPMRKAHGFIRELLDWIESRLRPGAIPAELCREAFARAERAGYGEFFMNRGEAKVAFIGHGTGLELDEWPVLTEKWLDPLRPGMIIAVEPKIIFPEGGVGIENTYLITTEGPPENLTPYPDSIQDLDGL